MTKHEEALRKAELSLLELSKKVSEAKHRQMWHFSPKAGWMNDPNGLIFFKGKYHIFYQFNPYGAKWSAMHWGHAISDDLVNWEHLPIALAPSESYDNHPQGGCFSGSAVDDNGVLTLIYTATTNYGDGFVQSQCIATSKDGIHFEKYEGNPVIPGPPACGSKDFRDPKVWKHHDQWYMVVGSSKDNRGKALLYQSDDLRKWQFVNVLCESRGELGTMWECPDFFEIDGKSVLMFSPMGLGDRKTVYLVGDMDYKTGKVHYQSAGEVDWGFDFYAPQSMIDDKGRRIIFAWANAWDWMPWWKDFGPTENEGWCGSLSFPRQIKLMKDGKLQFIPVDEIEKLRVSEKESVNLNVSDARRVSLPASGKTAYEMKLELDLENSGAKQAVIELKADEEKSIKLCCDLASAEISIDRSNSDGWSTGINRCPLESAGKSKLVILVYVDRSYVEVYTDHYRTVLSSNVFSDEKATQAFICAKGGNLRGKVTCYELGAMKITG